jgi:hypothetical protein
MGMFSRICLEGASQACYYAASHLIDQSKNYSFNSSYLLIFVFLSFYLIVMFNSIFLSL